MNTSVPAFLLGVCVGMKLLSYTEWACSFSGCNTMQISQVTVLSSRSHPQDSRGRWLLILAHTGVACLLGVSHSGGGWWYYCGFDLHFSDGPLYRAPFHMFFWSLNSLFCEMALQALKQFFLFAFQRVEDLYSRSKPPVSQVCYRYLFPRLLFLSSLHGVLWWVEALSFKMVYFTYPYFYG